MQIISGLLHVQQEAEVGCSTARKSVLQQCKMMYVSPGVLRSQQSRHAARHGPKCAKQHSSFISLSTFCCPPPNRKSHRMATTLADNASRWRPGGIVAVIECPRASQLQTPGPENPREGCQKGDGRPPSKRNPRKARQRGNGACDESLSALIAIVDVAGVSGMGLEAIVGLEDELKLAHVPAHPKPHCLVV